MLALPAALTVYLAFNAGGYFVDGTAAAAVLLAVLLVLRTTLEERSSRPTAEAAVAIACLGAFAVWVLLSGAWSDSWSRALVEFSRVLVYLLALVAFATLVGAAEGLRTALRWFALAAVVVCAVALASRLLPDLVPSRPNLANSRLSYPITYWNALGLLGVLGVIACAHLGSSVRERRLFRVLGTAAVPLLCVTVYFTFSRGSVLVAVVGLLLYLLLGRARGLLSMLLAAVPASTVAVAIAYGAEALASRDPTAAAASSQAGRVAAVTAVAMLGAGAVRALMLPLDRRLARVRMSRLRARNATIVVAGALAAVLLVGGLAVDAPAKLERQYDRFVIGTDVSSGDDARGRFSDPGNNGRVDYWKVSLDAWREEPWRGVGAGGWQFEWAAERPRQSNAVNGHSLYLEVLAELGLVGAVLLAATLLALGFGLARRLPRGDRSVYAALLAMGLTWALHAGIDWDWEMPVVSLWLFALAGAALARSRADVFASVAPSRLSRLVAGLGILVVATTPALLFLSQRQLNRTAEAFERGDCGETVEAGLAANALVSVRPEPLELLAYCDVRLGRPELAVRIMREAAERDPRDWRLAYGLALARGAAGLDPRPVARHALRLNPRSPLTRDAVGRFATESPRKWRRRALSARLPLTGSTSDAGR